MDCHLFKLRQRVNMDNHRVIAGRSLAAKIRATASASAHSRPARQTVSVGKATSPPSRITCPASNSANQEFLAKVCELNVDVQIQQILLRSTILQEMLAKKEIGIVGSVYDLTTAKVKFIESDLIF